MRSRRLRYIASSALLAAIRRACPVGSAAEIHYGPGEDLERIDVALIGEAAKQIDMAAYVLTDGAVNGALRPPSAALRRESGATRVKPRGSVTSAWRRNSAARFRVSSFDQTRPAAN